MLADLRRRGFALGSIRTLVGVLRTQFGVRLFEAIDGGGAVTLYIDRTDIYARTEAGELFNVLESPGQPLLALGEEPKFRQLTAREHHAKPKRPARVREVSPSAGSGTSSRGRRPAAE